MFSFETARRRILENVGLTETENVPLLDACGRTLAEEFLAWSPATILEDSHKTWRANRIRHVWYGAGFFPAGQSGLNHGDL